jgi:hypothetical protein
MASAASGRKLDVSLEIWLKEAMQLLRSVKNTLSVF